MFPSESRQKVTGQGIYLAADTSKTAIPNKAGFRLYITKVFVECSIAAAQLVTLESVTTNVDYWRFSGNVLGLHGFDRADVGLVVADGEGVKFTSVAGPEFSYLIEGYYDLIGVGT